jgi:hypothetical protein
MPVVAEGSEQMKWRRPRTQFLQQPISEMDPPIPNPPQIPSIIQSTRCKSTISSLLLSTFSNTNINEATPTTKKKNNFTSTKFRGLGCTASASQQVSVPAVIRGSADWEAKKSRKKKKKQKKNFNNNHDQGAIGGDGSSLMSCVDVQDVWCGPGIGFSAEDCVVARRNGSSGSGRGKIDGDNNKITHAHRERPCLARRAVNPEPVSFLDSEPDYVSTRPGLEVFGTRYYRHARHPSPEGLAEVCICFICVLSI